MKVAIITSGFLPVLDGVTVSGWYRVQRLSKWGHNVLLLAPDYSELEHLYPDWQKYTGDILPGVRVVSLASDPMIGAHYERNPNYKSYPILMEELEAFQPDIIHVDEPERLFVGFRHKPAIAYARKAGIPCVGFYRTNFIEYIDDYFPLPPIVAIGVKSAFKAFLRWVYNSYDATLIHSKIIHQKLVEIGINNTIFENLNGYDADRFHPGLKQANFFAHQYNQPQIDGQVKLVFLGRLTVDKGWNFTIKAFEQISQTIDLSKVAILIAGDGDMRQEITTELGKYTNNIHLLGRIPPDQVAALLANSDIFVTASEKENRALTIIEALAVGLPILAPRAGGIPQDVQDGWNGYLFEPQNQTEFVQKLKKLVEDTELRQQMGKNSYEYVKKYSWDNTIANMVNIWQTQINRKNPT